MNADEHIALAELMLENAKLHTQDSQTLIIAGELVWGASVHAIHAAGHTMSHSARHPINHVGLYDTLMTLGTDNDLQKTMAEGLSIAQRRLHNNFYTARLSETELVEDLADGFIFVRLLLDATEQGR